MKPAVMLSRGFTLIEMVVVMVVMGIIGVSVTMLIQGPIDMYLMMSRRAALTDQADNTLHLIQRDVRGALPNSVRRMASGNMQALEFVPVVYAGRYRGDQPGDYLDIANEGTPDTSFNVVGNSGISVSTDLSGLRMVVAPTDTLTFYSAAAGSAAKSVVTPVGTAFSVSDVTFSVPQSGGGTASFTETRIVYSPAHIFPDKSPSNRFYFVGKPVSYVCDTDAHKLWRYVDYGFLSSQSLAPAGSAQLVAENLSFCSFDYYPGNDKRNGVARLTLGFQDDSGVNPEVVKLLGQLRVNNAP